MNTICGRQYLCTKDFKQGNCSYTKGKIYHCSRNGYLNDDHNVSWSCTEQWFKKYLRIVEQKARKEDEK